MAYYTGLNTRLIETVQYISVETKNQEMINSLRSVVNMSRASEYAGLARGILTNVFAKKEFAPGFFEKFVRVLSMEEMALDLFRSVALEPQKAKLALLEQAPVVQKANAFRDVARAQCMS